MGAGCSLGISHASSPSFAQVDLWWCGKNAAHRLFRRLSWRRPASPLLQTSLGVWRYMITIVCIPLSIYHNMRCAVCDVQCAMCWRNGGMGKAGKSVYCPSDHLPAFGLALAPSILISYVLVWKTPCGISVVVWMSRPGKESNQKCDDLRLHLSTRKGPTKSQELRYHKGRYIQCMIKLMPVRPSATFIHTPGLV